MGTESFFRFLIFVGIFIVLAILEYFFAFQTVGEKRTVRWLRHFALNGGGVLLVYLLLPLTAIQFAAWVGEQGFGLLNFVTGPAWVKTLAAFFILDLAIYAQHVAFHYIPIFWRLHRLHHEDKFYDLSTGIRFHPLEIFLSMCWKFAVIFAIGAPPQAVLWFEVVLNGMSLFTHLNIAFNPKADRVLRWVLVSPNMHRIHHSDDPAELNSNFGFHVSWWDRLFRTYR